MQADSMSASALPALQYPGLLQQHAAIMHVEADFRALRDNYVRYETKQAVMEALVKGGDALHISAQQLHELELSVSDAVAAVAAIKREGEQLQARMKILTTQLVQQHVTYEQLAQQKHHVAAQDPAGDEAENAALRANQQQLATLLMAAKTQHAEGQYNLGKSAADELRLDSEDRCSRVLQNQIAAIEFLAQETQKAQDAIAELQWQVEPLRAQVRSLSSRVAETADADRNTAESAREDQLQRLEAACAIMKAVAGDVVLRVCSNSAMCLELRLPSGHVMALTYDISTGRIEDVQINPRNVELRDLVEYCRSSGDMGFLVREAAGRCQWHAVRQAQISAACHRFVCQWDEKHCMLTATLDIGVVASLILSPDFPSPTSQVVVQRLESVCGWTEDTLQEAKDVLNGKQHRDVTQLLLDLSAMLVERPHNT